MFYALGWLVVALLLALWSLAAWALHAAAAWTVTHAGVLAAGAPGVGAIALPEPLARWLPPEIAQWLGAWLAGLGPLADSLLAAVPALSGGVTVVAWGVWGLGSVLLVLLGAGLHLLIVLWRRRGASTAGSAARSPWVAG